MNFLEELSIDEWHSFASMAEERTFARGARPMREGDPADYVMVIINGRTQITIHDNGRERVIVERGPGQLIGEVGALQVNVRSATVTALETVRALVMRTKDFADFLSAHQRVLAIVENQIDARLTQDPYQHRRNDSPARPHVVAPPQAGTPSPPSLSGENCTVFLTDIVGFGAHGRRERDRQIIRTASLDMTRRSLGHLWQACISEDQGDGLLVVVPPAIPTMKIMERLHRELPRELRLHNHTYAEPARIRLRLAANVGPVITDPLGISGETIIRASRLLDAPVLRNAMAATDASLGMIVSAFVYDTAIRHAEGWADPGLYSVVEVNVKESRIPAWMQLIDTSPPAPRSPGA